MKTVLIAGASSGIGESAARLLSGEGYNLVLVSRHLDQLERLKGNLSSGNHQCHQFDFFNTDGIGEFVEGLVSQGTRIDGLIYCIGSGMPLKLRRLCHPDLAKIYQANFFSFVELLRNLCQGRSNDDCIFKAVAFSSLAATHSNTKFYTPYSSSKAALESAARVLAPELFKKRACITIIKPGYVDTPRLENDKLMHPDLEDYLRETNYQPCGLIPPATISRLISLLLSVEDYSFNGAILPVPAGAVS